MAKKEPFLEISPPEPAAASDPDVDAAIAYVRAANLSDARDRHSAFVYQLASQRYAGAHAWFCHWKALPLAERQAQDEVFLSA